MYTVQYTGVHCTVYKEVCTYKSDTVHCTLYTVQWGSGLRYKYDIQLYFDISEGIRHTHVHSTYITHTYRGFHIHSWHWLISANLTIQILYLHKCAYTKIHAHIYSQTRVRACTRKHMRAYVRVTICFGVMWVIFYDLESEC